MYIDLRHMTVHGLVCVCSTPYNDIRFSLMSVVRDKRVIYKQKLENLERNKATILKTLAEVG